ncbi:MAG: ribosome biogenesis GTP-binding protein YihA/YsxC [Bacteroidota bacterium]|nr:ribosome biogenesis GTP-binding protein YihA/YsxC [Bacteroidota bacterium]
MTALSVTLERSVADPAQFPKPDLPEVVFVGRSNVGKSSLLNALIGRPGVARVSNTPGKTRLIHFYRVEDGIRFVDLPGYGYARASAAERARWAELVRSYFDAGRPLALVLQLVDSRLPLQKSDADMIAWFVSRHVPVQIVMTKTDKITQKELHRNAHAMLRAVRALGCGSTLIGFSARKGSGRKELLRAVFTAAGGGT